MNDNFSGKPLPKEDSFEDFITSIILSPSENQKDELSISTPVSKETINKLAQYLRSQKTAPTTSS